MRIHLQSKFMTEQLAAMSASVDKLNSQIERAASDGYLMESTAKNIRSLLAGASTDVYFNSANELAWNLDWQDLNDRSYQTLASGTGGLRGRTIGKFAPSPERGTGREGDRHRL